MILHKHTQMYKNKEWLHTKYVVEEKSFEEIAKEGGIVRGTLVRWMSKCNIPMRTLKDAQEINFKRFIPYRNKKWLQQKYYGEHKSLSQIARQIDSSTATVQKWFKTFGIKARPAKPYEGAYNWKWKGKSETGSYIHIYMPEHPRAVRKRKYVPEHVVVMEKVLGRYLDGKEIVHHKDGNKKNNNPKNLQLMKNMSDHIKYESMLGLFAKQLLYGTITDEATQKKLESLFIIFQNTK